MGALVIVVFVIFVAFAPEKKGRNVGLVQAGLDMPETLALEPVPALPAAGTLPAASRKISAVNIRRQMLSLMIVIQISDGMIYFLLDYCLLREQAQTRPSVDGVLSAPVRADDAILPTCLNGVLLTFSPAGQVDQLEDRYLGMVEASGSNPDLSTFVVISFPGPVIIWQNPFSINAAWR